jgi:hypothetical protein
MYVKNKEEIYLTKGSFRFEFWSFAVCVLDLGVKRR